MFINAKGRRGLLSLVLIITLVVSLFAAMGHQPAYADDGQKNVCIYYADGNPTAYGGELLLANDKLRVFDNSNTSVEIGDAITNRAGATGYKHFEFRASPGLYSFVTYKDDGVTIGGEGVFEIDAKVSETQNFFLVPLRVNTTLSTEITDYDVEVIDYLQQPIPIGNTKIEPLHTGGSTKTYTYIAMLTSADKPYSYTVIPKDEDNKNSEKYAPVTGEFYKEPGKTVAATAGLLFTNNNTTITVSPTLLYNVTFKVTKGAGLSVTWKFGGHFTPFTQYKVTYLKTKDGYDYFNALISSSFYAHAGGHDEEGKDTGFLDSNFGGQLDHQKLTPSDESSFTLTWDVVSADAAPPTDSNKVNWKWMENDVVVNVNDARHLVLSKGEAFNLLPIRVWQGQGTDITANYFLEPDYDFDALGKSGVVGIEKAGSTGLEYLRINALESGTNVIRFTYNPLAIYSYQSDGQQLITGDITVTSEDLVFYHPAIDTVNTGVVVVEVVDDKDSANGKSIKTNIGEREFDTIYFDRDTTNHATYTFKPEADSDVKVRVHDPLHKAEWGEAWTDYGKKKSEESFTVNLKEGRNIIEVGAEGSDYREYHVVEVKGVKINIENRTDPTWRPGDPFHAGDVVALTFDGIQRPIPKIAGIYNPGYGGKSYVRYETSDGREVRSRGVQYTVAEENELIVSLTEPGKFRLVNGTLPCGSMGSAVDGHRISVGTSVYPNLNAAANEGDFSTMPDIAFDVLPSDEDASRWTYGELERFRYEYVNTLTNLDGIPLHKNLDLKQGDFLQLRDGNDLYGQSVPKNRTHIDSIIARTWTDGNIASDSAEVIDQKYDEERGYGEGMVLKGGTSNDGAYYAELTVTPDDKYGLPSTYSFRRINSAGAWLHPWLIDVRLTPASDDKKMDLYDGKLLAVDEGGGDLGLGYGFIATRDQFSTTLPNEVDAVRIVADPLNDTKILSGRFTNAVTEDRATAVTVEGSSGLTVTDEGDNTWLISGIRPGVTVVNSVTITGTAPDAKEGEEPETVAYTLNIHRAGATKNFSVPAVDGGKLTIRQRNGVRINPNGNGTYYLPEHIGYKYVYERSGYETTTGTFDVTGYTEEVASLIAAPNVPVNQVSGKATVSVLGGKAILRDGEEIAYDVDGAKGLPNTKTTDLAVYGYVEYNPGGYTLLNALIDSFKNGAVDIPFTARLGLLSPTVQTDGEPNAGAGWVCEVNGSVIPPDELWTMLVRDGDEIVYYYNAANPGQQFVSMSQEGGAEQPVERGNPATLTLTGKDAGTSGAGSPVAGAKVYIDGHDSGIMTGTDGKAAIDTSGLSYGTHVVTVSKGEPNALTYARALITVTKPQDAAGNGITFRLIGAKKHPGQSGYGPATEYVNWIKTVKYPLTEGTVSVYTVFDWALENAGLQYKESMANYIGAIKAPTSLGGYWLSEMDNGPLSGWMYTVNGIHASEGLRAQEVGPGDEIIWHYVDDPTLEAFDALGGGGKALYPSSWLTANDADPGKGEGGNSTVNPGKGDDGKGADDKKDSTPVDLNKNTATPLSLATITLKAADVQWTGKDVKSGLTLTATYGSPAKTVKLAAADYTLAKASKWYRNIGKAKVTVVGKGANFTGSKTVTFNIVPKKVAISKVTAGKKLIKATWKKAAKAQKITGYQIQYKAKGVAKWSKLKNVSNKKTAYTAKKLQKGKRYEVRVRAYKKVGGKKYYSPWSAVKTGGKVK